MQRAGTVATMHTIATSTSSHFRATSIDMGSGPFLGQQTCAWGVAGGDCSADGTAGALGNGALSSGVTAATR